MTKIKICGLKRMKDIQVANQLNPDFIGFVFAKSKRQITAETAKTLKSMLKPTIKVCGVFVNEKIQTMCDLVKENTIDVIQLHGNETEKDIEEIKSILPQTEVIKALNVRQKTDIITWENSKADYLILDNGVGGTGEKFDWEILKELTNFHKKIIIAGGLDPKNVSEVLKFNPYGVDVSSGVETDGYKDKEKMHEFVQKVRGQQ